VSLQIGPVKEKSVQAPSTFRFHYNSLAKHGEGTGATKQGRFQIKWKLIISWAIKVKSAEKKTKKKKRPTIPPNNKGINKDKKKKTKEIKDLTVMRGHALPIYVLFFFSMPLPLVLGIFFDSFYFTSIITQP